MKKLIWLICLSMLLGLLAGCQTEPVGTQPSGGMATTGTAEPTGTTVAQVTEPVDIRPLPPENPGNSLIEYDPDRQIYIASENVYVDYYIGVSSIASFYFPIYSRQPLNPEEISVSFPVDLPFILSVQDAGVERKPQILLENGTSGDFPYYVYLAYLGETFEDGKDVSAVDLVNGIYEVENSDGELVYAGDVLAGKYELKDGEEIEQRYLDFASLTEEDLPELYVYNVVIGLYNITELQETVVLDKLDVTIGSEVYEAKLGRVRLFSQKAFPTDATIANWDSKAGNYCKLYNDGIFSVYGVLKIAEIPEDITLTGLRFAEEATEILEITVIMNSEGQYMEMKWDGVSPIYLYKGDSIEIDVIVKNEHAGKLLNFVVCNTIVEYTNSANELLCAVSTQVGSEGRNPYEYYAIIFDGLDMEPYYRNYFYKNFFQWFDDYRGK